MKKFCLTSLFLLLFSLQAQAAAVQHNFTVFLGPFNTGKTRFTYSLTPQNYSVRSKVETTGIFDTLYPFAAEYATTGNIKGKDLETSSYKYKSKAKIWKPPATNINPKAVLIPGAKSWFMTNTAIRFSASAPKTTK